MGEVYRARDTYLGEEVAVNEEDAEIGFYAGGGLELEDVLREQVLLSLPMQKICRQDCKGICPRFIPGFKFQLTKT
jgi:uncharacterized protein